MESYFIRKINKYDKKNKKYQYRYYTKNGRSLSFNKIKHKLNNIYIPPAYDNVKINLRKNDKIIAIGYDTKNRAQYIYHNNYKQESTDDKFSNLIDFGKNYQRILSKINNDLLSKNEKIKQIAMILKIIIDCNFRIGNKKYTRDNNSFGVSTLQKKHLSITKNEIIIDFIGKKGVRNKCTLKNKHILNNIKKKRKSLNKNDNIFTYDKSKKITSKDVNDYLKQFGNYTTKNFRTWGANIQLIKLLLKYNDFKKCITIVADKLHHTPSICKKNYIDNNLIEFYKSQPEKFIKYFSGNVNDKFIKFLKSNY